MATEIELETHEIHEKLDELREEHERAGAFGNLVKAVALTVGIMAVLAAVSAQQAATLATEALLLSNQSVLQQAKATDTWNEYQADSVKSKVYDTQALVATSTGGEASQFADLAKTEKDKQPPLMEEAQKLEGERDALLQESQDKNAQHETFARSVGAMQIGIALASIAALTRRREMWWLGSTFGLIGAGLLGYGFTGGTL